MVCGIYRITNLNNGKKYIGQSRNICARWKQHTQSLDKMKAEAVTPLRHAFIKYGLKNKYLQRASLMDLNSKLYVNVVRTS
ncbi:MAG: GIY-YIG nuclease family protein [Bacteroidales bacterium]|nr:GIY-YIG nuclease family protein [Bacteroidales bacterium]